MGKVCILLFSLSHSGPLEAGGSSNRLIDWLHERMGRLRRTFLKKRSKGGKKRITVLFLFFHRYTQMEIDSFVFLYSYLPIYLSGRVCT